MLSPDEVFTKTGYEIGGVCPFAVNDDVPVFLDESLRRFETVFPACGSSNNAIELTMDQPKTYTRATKWVDVCRNWQKD